MIRECAWGEEFIPSTSVVFFRFRFGIVVYGGVLVCGRKLLKLVELLWFRCVLTSARVVRKVDVYVRDSSEC